MKPFHTAWGALVVLSTAGVALAYLRSAPQNREGNPPRNNQHMSQGWQAAQAYWNRYYGTQPIVRLGEQAMGKGRYAEAETQFNRALSIFPQNARALLLLAEVSEREGKDQQAIRAYHELVHSNEKGWGSSINSDPTTLMRYVLALSRGGQWHEAVAVYDRAVRQATPGTGGTMAAPTARFSPNRPDWPRLKAEAHYLLGTRRQTWGPADPADQLKHLAAVVSIEPNRAEAQLAYGDALAKAGRRAEARAAYSRAATQGQGAVKLRAQEALGRLHAAGR